MGLRIMRYRASLIGATLDVQNAEGGGTLVRCTLAKEARDDEEGDGGEAEAGADPAGG